MTNATKANVIGVLNAGLGVAMLFGLAISVEQAGGLLALANALGVLIVGLTYKDSPKRVDESYDDGEFPRGA